MKISQDCRWREAMSEDTIPPDPNCFDCREGNAHEHEQTYHVEREAMSEIEKILDDLLEVFGQPPEYVKRPIQEECYKITKTKLEQYCNRQVIGELEELVMAGQATPLLQHRINELKSKLGEE